MNYRIIIERTGESGAIGRETLVDAAEEEGGALVVYGAEGAGANVIRTTGALRIYFSDSCIIDQRYESTASALLQRYRSIFQGAVMPATLCFTVDAHWEPSEASNDNSVWKVDIAKAGKWLRAFGGAWRYEVRLRKFWLDEWTPAQFHAAILSQLLRIDPSGDGSVRKYSIEFQDALTATFGQGYLNRGVNIPDVLERDVPIRWFREATGQITVDEVLNGAAPGGALDGPGPGEDDEDCEGDGDGAEGTEG